MPSKPWMSPRRSERRGGLEGPRNDAELRAGEGLQQRPDDTAIYGERVKIVCVHTAASNIEVFDRQLSSGGYSDVRLRHFVCPDLLAAAESAGGLDATIRAETAGLLQDLAGRSDGVLLTCSTLGPAVDDVRDAAAVVLRVDQALAEQAVLAAQQVVALCAVRTTVGPTTHLFEQAAHGTNARVTVRLVDGAWDLFKAGDIAGYHASVAAAADQALADGADVVALAQASMAAATALCASASVLASPQAGLGAIVAAATGRSGSVPAPQSSAG